jgi:hypothetical protein
MNRKSLGTLVLIWMGWFLVLYAFQWLVEERFEPQRPDTAVSWSRYLTGEDSESRSVYLMDPLLNAQTAWDSEYYIGIAAGGYDDPQGGRETNPQTGVSTTRNYSFFPLYPYVMKVLAVPLQIFGLSRIATAALAGVILSLLGTLAGMTALYDLTKDYFDEDGRLRTAFYLLIFPSGFFLAQIYTEGLFIGLAFWSLALMKRRQWLWASLLAALAAWTRAHGVALALPLAYYWWTAVGRKESDPGFLRKWVLQGLCVLLPVAAYLLWRNSPLGQGWAELQAYYFGRGFLLIDATIRDWQAVYEYALRHPPALVYFGIVVLTVGMALVSSLVVWFRDRPVALFSLAVLILSAFSGGAQSMDRYALMAPATFIALAWLGRNRAFDRIWTVASILLMGVEAAMFTFNFWAG